MSEAIVPNPQELAAEMRDQHLNRQLHAVNQWTNVADEQSFNDYNDYLNSRPYQDNRGRLHSPDGSFISSNGSYFDKTREAHEFITRLVDPETGRAQSYEEMGMVELARTLGDAERRDDKTTASNVTDILLDKMADFAAKNNLIPEAQDALLNRLIKVTGAKEAEKREEAVEATTAEPVTEIKAAETKQGTSLDEIKARYYDLAIQARGFIKNGDIGEGYQLADEAFAEVEKWAQIEQWDSDTLDQFTVELVDYFDVSAESKAKSKNTEVRSDDLAAQPKNAEQLKQNEIKARQQALDNLIDQARGEYGNNYIKFYEARDEIRFVENQLNELNKDNPNWTDEWRAHIRSEIDRRIGLPEDYSNQIITRVATTENVPVAETLPINSPETDAQSANLGQLIALARESIVKGDQLGRKRANAQAEQLLKQQAIEENWNEDELALRLENLAHAIADGLIYSGANKLSIKDRFKSLFNRNNKPGNGSGTENHGIQGADERNKSEKRAAVKAGVIVAALGTGALLLASYLMGSNNDAAAEKQSRRHHAVTTTIEEAGSTANLSGEARTTVEKLADSKDTIWGHARQQLIKQGNSNPTGAEIYANTQRILDQNHINWIQARNLPDGFEFNI